MPKKQCRHPLEVPTANEGTTGPTESREEVAGAAVGRRVRVLLALRLQNKGAFAAILDDHCMHSRLNKQYDFTIHFRPNVGQAQM